MKLLQVIFTTFFLVLVISHFHQSFSQVPWTKYNSGNPVLLSGSPGEWDDSGIVGPSVIFDGTTYKMWYGAWNGVTFRIGYAYSTDGISWTKYDDPLTTNPPYAESDPVVNLGPGAFESVWVYFPQVYFDGTIYHMWYAGTDGNHDRVGYATSSDGGITWEKDIVHNPVINLGSPGSWEEVAVVPGPVQFNGTTYEMIYNGYDGLLFQGGYATSPDGVVWTKDSINNPIFPAGSPTSWDYPRANPGTVVYNSNTSLYYTFYSGGEFGNWRMGYATAPAFSGPWTKNPSPLFDSSAVAFPSVIYDPGDNLYKMWYSGDGIEYATAPVVLQDTIYIPANFSTIQEGINAANNGNIVLVDEGTYLENINFRGKAITVASKFFVDGDTTHIENTIIDGSQPTDPDSGSVVTFNSGEDSNSVICGFTITGGSGTIGYNIFYGTYDKGGGGILANEGCRINHNIITQNEINRTTLSNAYGGGISCGENTIIENNIINNNSITCAISQAGAAGVFIGGSGTRLINNSITDNTAITNATDWNTNGGGIIVYFSNVLITGNTIARNKALAPNCTAYPCYGGGLHALESNESVLFYNNILIDNIAQGNNGSYGGGINLIDGSNSLIRNNIIARNISSIGGGISCLNSTGSLQPPTIMNNTVSLNEATSGQAGGIFSLGSWTPEVANSIFWENTNGTGSEVSGSVNIQYSDVEGGYSGTGNIDVDPNFDDSTFFVLNTLSLCVDAGNPDPIYNDVEDPQIPGYALLPARGTLINDMGNFGGPNSLWSTWDIPVSVESDATENGIPNKYTLSQNYPNPFNPSTKIKYSVPQASKVQIKIFDVLGNEIETLVNGEKPSGSYELTWYAENLPSGVYFYRLQAGSFVETKKMILLK